MSLSLTREVKIDTKSSYIKISEGKSYLNSICTELYELRVSEMSL